MDILLYLAIALGIIVSAYIYYRLVFLKKSVKKTPKHPHFTFKIKTE